ncbi:MAG: hypothetical protein F4153_02400 [Acidimicrobiia bacterium]|nr:hypothetical protein [Acidimicrobiia bacterium]
MHRVRQVLAAAVAVALLVSGCDRGANDTAVTTIGLLSAALADTAEASEASSYRESISFGVVWNIEGEEISTGLDEKRPVVVSEISPERDYSRFNMGTFMKQLFGFLPPGFDELEIEVWSDDERAVMDTTALQQLADAEPRIDLGPMAPGVFSINWAAIEADSTELKAALSGSSSPDLSEMAKSLPAALITIEHTSNDPSTFVGTTTSARLNEALGWNTEEEARYDAADFGMDFSADPDELAELFLDFYETNTVEVVIELDERGLLSVLWTDEDLSGIFRIIAESEDLRAEFSEEEAEVFDSIEFRMVTRVAYEPDADIEVPLPPPTDEDRTEEWRELLVVPNLDGWAWVHPLGFDVQEWAA